MTRATDRSVALLEAYACEQLIRRFALHNDAGDYDALAAMFTEDGSFARPTDPDNPVQGRSAIHAFFRDRPRRFTRHVMANVIVDMQGEARAQATSYVLLYVADPTAGQPPHPISAPVLVGQFDDLLLREVDGWKFSSRRGSLAITL